MEFAMKFLFRGFKLAAKISVNIKVINPLYNNSYGLIGGV